MTARLPTPNADEGTWGNILNDFLSVTHNADGTIKNNTVTESQLTSAVQTKLNSPSNIPESSVTNLVSDLAAKAPLASPTFTGIVTVPTPGNGTDAANKTYVDSQVSGSSVVINVKSYGATGNGSTDDTTAAQNALSAANTNGGGIVFFPKGTYLCNDLTIYANVIVTGQGWSSIIKQKTGSTYLLSVNSGSGGTSNPAQNASGIVVRDLQLLGTVVADGFSQGIHLLNMNAVSDVLVQNVLFKGFRSDGIYLGSSNTGGLERHNQRVRIVECMFDGVNNDNRNAISVIDGDDVTIDRCSFANCTRSNMPGAIDLEPNPGSSYAVIRGIRVTNNVFRNIGGNTGAVAMYHPTAQASLTTPTQGILASGNTFYSLVDGGCAFYFHQAGTPTGTTTANDITIVDNAMFQVGRPAEFEGIRGVTMARNTVDDSYGAVVIGYTSVCFDIAIEQNKFSKAGNGDGSVISPIQATRTTIRGNIFDNCGLTDGSFGILVNLTTNGVSGATDTIYLINNITSGVNTTAVTTKSASHTTVAASNYSLDNYTGALSVSTAIFAAPNNTNLLGGEITNGSAIFTAEQIDGAPGTNRDLAFMSNGNYRWLIRANTSSESGSNAGTNLDIISRADNGSQLLVVMSFLRASGTVQLGDGVNLSLGGTTGTTIGATTSQKLAFYGNNPIVRPVLSYSRSGAGETSAAAALRQALANLGLVTDSTTA